MVPNKLFFGITGCAFGLTLYKTFRRHGLQLLAGLIQPGVADAMEGTVDRGRTHAVCIEDKGRREPVLVVPGKVASELHAKLADHLRIEEDCTIPQRRGECNRRKRR